MIIFKNYLIGDTMKLFIFLAFCLISLFAETQNPTNENCEDCQAVLPAKRVESELKSILQKIRDYKKDKNRELTTLRKKIDLLKKTFAHYKSEKEYEIKQLKKSQIKKSTIYRKNREIKKLQKKLALMKRQLAKKKKTIISLKEKLSQESQPIVVATVVKKEETPKKWIKITVDNDLNIYDLALKYYGDSQEYEKIYMANQNKIDRDYQIRNGMSLKIPITENFIEQPMFINTAN